MTDPVDIAVAMASGLPLQGTPEGCFDTCWGAAHDLNAALKRSGSGGRIVMLKGWLGVPDIPLVGNHEEWARMGPSLWTHWLVKAGPDMFIDMTARQFDASLAHPQIDDRAALFQRWRWVDGDGREPDPQIVW